MKDLGKQIAHRMKKWGSRQLTIKRGILSTAGLAAMCCGAFLVTLWLGWLFVGLSLLAVDEMITRE